MRLRERLPGIDSSLVDLSDDELRLWIYGFLHRHRVRGALDHPYLNEFASQDSGGSTHLAGRSRARDVSPGRALQTAPDGHAGRTAATITCWHPRVEAARPGTLSGLAALSAVRKLDETSVLDLIPALAGRRSRGRVVPTIAPGRRQSCSTASPLMRHCSLATAYTWFAARAVGR